MDEALSCQLPKMWAPYCVEAPFQLISTLFQMLKNDQLHESAHCLVLQILSWLSNIRLSIFDKLDKRLAFCYHLCKELVQYLKYQN